HPVGPNPPARQCVPQPSHGGGDMECGIVPGAVLQPEGSAGRLPLGNGNPQIIGEKGGQGRGAARSGRGLADDPFPPHPLLVPHPPGRTGVAGRPGFRSRPRGESPLIRRNPRARHPRQEEKEAGRGQEGRNGPWAAARPRGRAVAPGDPKGRKTYPVVHKQQPPSKEVSIGGGYYRGRKDSGTTFKGA